MDFQYKDALFLNMRLQLKFSQAAEGSTASAVTADDPACGVTSAGHSSSSSRRVSGLRIRFKYIVAFLDEFVDILFKSIIIMKHVVLVVGFSVQKCTIS